MATTSTGFFSASVGSGAPTSGYPAASVHAAFANNSTSMTGRTYGTATACTYVPALGDARQLAVFVTVPGVAEDALGKLVINQAESAVVADSALSISGISSSNILLANTTTSNLTQANLNNIFTATNYAVLTNLIAQGASGYVSAAANGTVNVPTQSSPPASPTTGEMWYDTSSNSLKYYNGSSIQSVGNGFCNWNRHERERRTRLNWRHHYNFRNSCRRCRNGSE